MNRPRRHLPSIPFGALGSPVGVGLAAVGVLLVALGWNGAASQLSVTAQVPYLLSGGMLGLSLVILGAAVIVVTAAREDRARLEAKLDEVIAATAGQGARAATGAPRDLAGLVVAGSASYHAPDCRLVAGREQSDYLTSAEAEARALKACRVCRPAAVPRVRLAPGGAGG